ncbi:glycoside hydrolase family 31 protein [Microbacterium sp. NPDC087589]|uniref:glycoside hydrolase family 31 protein n=1 Tax=Microbacterium sp. NPDC087589 TaxID=3364191 RepID=UPI00381C8814
MTVLSDSTVVSSRSRLELAVEPGERWWGGAIEDGAAMPFGQTPFERNLGVPESIDNSLAGRPSNQSAPLLLSTAGRFVWSEHPFEFSFQAGLLQVTGHELQMFETGGTLRDAFLAASDRFFPASGSAPAREMFSSPQYNTWIEQPYLPTQQSVLTYARALLDSGQKPGVLIIDDSWATGYGTWSFDEGRFPQPRQMVDQLHDWGFRVMLWLVPFISADSAAFRHLEREGMLVCGSNGQTALRRWWNGVSALLDVSNPAAVTWLTDQLDALVREVGIDGFKFDGGDVRDFYPDDITLQASDPVEKTQAWAAIGLRYPFNEFRACWRMGGQPLAQRLQDKRPVWGPEGIGSLVPEMLAQGMIGHAFTCPDMIGGGEIDAMTGQATIDQEFFVRYAQIAALSPMAQFSVNPSRVLDPTHLGAVEQAFALRDKLLPEILLLVEHAARTGEPIIRPMAYHQAGTEHLNDQYFLGPDLFVAPITEKGAAQRTVFVPEGRWEQDRTGVVFEGPAIFTIEVDLATIPLFSRESRALAPSGAH